MKTAKSILRTKRVAKVWDEGDANGVWAELKRGWRCPANDTHTCHEWTFDELYAAVLRAEQCQCDECQKGATP